MLRNQRCFSRVTVAGDGRAALELLATGHDALVLGDVMLPRRDGRALARVMRADPRLRPISLMLLSAGGSAPAREVLLRPIDARLP